MSPAIPTPLVIGVASLDVIRTTTGHIHVRLGGVCNNVARSVAALGAATVFVSPQYGGDIGAVMHTHLTATGVSWTPLRAVTPLAVFLATALPDGRVAETRFVDNGTIDALTPAVFDQQLDLPDSPGPIVTCTDLSAASLIALGARAAAHDIPFWVVASDATSAERLLSVSPRPDLVCLNQDELKHVIGQPEADTRTVLSEARGLVAPDGVCVVTCGPEGTILVDPSVGLYWHQAATQQLTGLSLGASDVLTAAVLVERLHGCDWPAALSSATAAAEHFIQSWDPLQPTFSVVQRKAPLYPGPVAHQL